MMTLKDQISKDITDVFFNTDEFAKEITYDGRVMQAIVKIDEQQSDGAAFDRGSADTATIRVKVSDVPMVEPKTVVGIDEKKWRVKGRLSSNGYTHVILLTANESQFPRGVRS